MEKFKYIKNISDGVGVINLYGPIGESISPDGKVEGVSGSSFTNELRYLQMYCNSIEVHINSIGGSVMDGYSIISAMLNSNIPCTTYIDGLAASIAGVIAVSGTKCCIMDYGTWMAHEPSGTDDKKMLGIVKDTLITILSNRTAKSPEEIDAMMKKETWISNSRKADYTLEQGIEMKIFDSIISSGKKLKLGNSLEEIASVYNKLLTTEKPKQMKNINNKLKLNDEASESEALVALDAIINKNVALEAEVTALKKEKTDAEAAAKVALTNKATALVNKAIEDKKITEAEKENTLANASASEAGYEFVKNFLDKISTVKKAEVIFDPKKVVNAAGSTEDRSSWTYNDWEKKDPNGLRNLYVSDNAAYQELFKTYNTKK